MSRVERTAERTQATENPTERRGNEHLRQAQNGRRGAAPRDPNPGHTPGKAEGEESDIEQALDTQNE